MVIVRALALAALAAGLAGCGGLERLHAEWPVFARGSYGSSSGAHGEVGIRF